MKKQTHRSLCMKETDMRPFSYITSLAIARMFACEISMRNVKKTTGIKPKTYILFIGNPKRLPQPYLKVFVDLFSVKNVLVLLLTMLFS